MPIMLQSTDSSNRELAKKIGADCIAVSPIPQIGLGLALNDRLQRAAFRN